ncbi:hypothetical protein FQN54_007312 [Arachnomyces sp. PD_36]|nr:hypothetical protein FQN54_007312 [Arachnomyces sp. PD_36]
MIGKRETGPVDPLPPSAPPQDAVLVGREEMCGEHECTKPVSTTTTMTLPIVLGAVIPLTVAIVVFFFLHRRHVKKLRHEDANDRHKSLDFGMEVVRQGKKNQGGENGFAGLETAEKPGHRGGVSLDLGNPYLLPPGLQNSTESLHSLSRTIHSDDDRYRTAVGFIPNDTSSMRSHPSNLRRGHDDSSSHTGSMSRLGGDEMQHNLLRNAQRMSRTSPPDSIAEHSISHPPPRSDSRQTAPQIDMPAPAHTVDHFPATPEVSTPRYIPEISTTAHDFDLSLGISTPPTPNAASTPPRVDSVAPQKPKDVAPTPLQAPRISLPGSDSGVPNFDNSINSTDADKDKSGPVVPELNIMPVDDQQLPNGGKEKPRAMDDNFEYGYEDPGFDTRRLTVGIRPLPPEDPSDNPEQRANRIRSFYKEYFDDSKPAQQEEYYEDYGPEFYGNHEEYYPMEDPYMMPAAPPFAQPEGRRAFTPPPRAPPQFQGRYRSGSSAGFMTPNPGPRAFSSASGRMGPGGRAGMPRKPMPPPSPLHVLPTPHMLKDDSMILPIDYAPANTSKERRAGRPETPKGGLRPYSPMLPAHVPLASSYDDLAAMPSPHALRKSGTFTALDFAPPPRFRDNADPGSDTGSIRSNRTGISAAHAHNLRTGAYRVSRLPAEAVGTRDQITANLRPKWDLGR